VAKVVVYARFSPRPREKHGRQEKVESNEFQIDYCKRWIEKNGHSLVAVFSDEYQSGSKSDRPGLWDALDALEKGGILVVYKRDRLARDVYLNEVILRQVAKAGATVQAVTGDVEGDSDEQKMIRQILSAIAEYERKVIALRTKHSMLRHQNVSHRAMSSRPPYGWKREGAALVKDEAEQLVIASIFGHARAGMGLREIGRELVSRGMMPRDAKVWQHKLIKKILMRRGG